MICTKCGANVPETSKFCPKCGAKTDNSAAPDTEAKDPNVSTLGEEMSDSVKASQDGTKSSTENQTGDVNDNFNRKYSKKTVWIIIISAVVVIAVILIIVLSNGRTTIRLNNYLTIEVSGYNGYGSAKCYINTDQLQRDYAGKVKLTSAGNSNLIMSMAVSQGEDPLDLVIPEIGGSLNKSEYLSNNDKLVFTWNDSEIQTIEHYVNVSIDTSNFNYTVSNLPEPTKEDIFAGVSVYYSGVSPEGTAMVAVNDSENKWLKASDIQLSQTEGLANGDIIIATIDDETLNTIFYGNGIEPVETEKEFTVEGLSELIATLDEVPADALDKMREQAESILTSEATEWGYTEINNIDFLGCYFLVAKNSSENKIYVVYKITQTTTYRDDLETYDRYWYTCYSDGSIDADGNFSIDYSNYANPEYTWDGFWGRISEGDGFSFSLNGQKFRFSGFETLDELYNSVVTSQLNDYNFESTVEGTG